MELIKELLTIYWGQITVLLLGLGYFIKRYFDSKSKKLEINHSLFQQNKINAISTFFYNYAKVESTWFGLKIYDVLDRKMTVDEIDNIIWPPINDLKKSVLELKIYFDQGSHKHFQNALDTYLELNDQLCRLYFNYDRDTKTTNKVNAFYLSQDNTKRKLVPILENITLVCRISFSTK